MEWGAYLWRAHRFQESNCNEPGNTWDNKKNAPEPNCAARSLRSSYFSLDPVILAVTPPRGTHPMALFGSRDENRIATLVDKLQEEGRVDQLEIELSRFKTKRLNDAERETWYHFWGIAAFQRGDRDEALKRFIDGRSACPDSSDIAFALGQEYERIGDVSNMLALFDAATFPKITAAYAIAQARYAYLWDHVDKAIDYVLPLLDAYYELKIADDHFVYVRGLPFFGETWAHLGAFLELQRDLSRLRSITEQAATKLSDYDFDRLRELVDCIESGNFQSHLTQLEEFCAQQAKHKIPVGMQRTQAAILHARDCDNAADALRILKDVTIDANDFPWLNDMLLLAQCEIADRFSSTDREKLIVQFFNRQALLFEPNHVFNFRMLQYQERLKKEFQRKRKAV